METMTFSPLAGTKVLDFSWNVAGPTSTKVLAALGADVIKVEWPTRADPIRGVTPAAYTDGVYDGTGFFSDFNIGKRSFAADPTTEAGHATIDKLLAWCDVIVESYSPRVMSGWGWTFGRMAELNPRLIYMSISGFGHTGPENSYVSYGPTAQAASGVSAASGEPSLPPAGYGYSYLDVMTGFQAALAVVGARVRQLKGAPAQRLDVSQIEVGAALIGPVLLDCILNGTVPTDGLFPPGNRAHWPRSSVNGYRYEGGAPYNVYPTSDAGHNGFCAISVLNEPEWHALRTAMGDPEWAAEEKYATEADRIRNQNELDMHVSEWTRQHGKYELMALLRAAGVRAGALQTGMDRLENDESLRARGVFQPLTHDVVGEHRYQSFPMLVNGEPLAIRPVWPILGRDTEAVLANELGLSPAQVDELREQGAIWPANVARPSYADPQPAGRPPAPGSAQPAADVQPTDAAPLAGITVVALDAGHASYTGKILTDFGARVILVEPPGGAEQRRATPVHHAKDGSDYSIPFAYYHAGQESVTVDLAAPGAAARLEPLIRQADVLLDGLGAGLATSLGLTPQWLAAVRPGLIYASISPFGQNGPWRDAQTSDTISLTLGGVAGQSGYESANGRPSQPISPSGGQSRHIPGLVAGITVVAVLAGRPAEGVLSLDFAMHDAIAVSTEGGVPQWEFNRMVSYRHTGQHASPEFTTPAWQFRSADGAYVVALTIFFNDRRFNSLVEMFDALGFEHNLRDERYATAVQRQPLMQDIVDLIGEFCGQHPAQFIMDEAQKRQLPWSVVRTPDQVAADPHLHARGFYQPLELFPGEQVSWPGLAWQGLSSALLDAARPGRTRPPQAGEDTSRLLGGGA
jgi:crotonobetainyl-CoA:carnitine CoA-transferase CaiB-like acyl-CoA transferase